MANLTLSYTEFKRIINVAGEFTDWNSHYETEGVRGFGFICVKNSPIDGRVEAYATDARKMIITPLQADLYGEQVFIPVRLRDTETQRWKKTTSIVKGGKESTVKIRIENSEMGISIDGVDVYSMKFSVSWFPLVHQIVPPVESCERVDSSEFETCWNGKDCVFREWGLKGIASHLDGDIYFNSGAENLRVDTPDGSLLMFQTQTFHENVFPTGDKPVKEEPELSPLDQYIKDHKVKGKRGKVAIRMAEGETKEVDAMLYGPFAYRNKEVTHIGTGLRLGGTFTKKANALTCIALVTPLADWEYVTEESFTELENFSLICHICMMCRGEHPTFDRMDEGHREKLEGIVNEYLGLVTV